MLERQHRAARKERLRDVARQAPEDVAGAEHLIEHGGRAAVRASDGELRQHVGDSHADFRRGRVQLGFGRAHVRALSHQFRRQRHRQFRRQLEIVERELGVERIGRQLARQGSQQVALQGQLLAQSWQCLLGLRKLGPGCGHFEAADEPECELFLQQVVQLGLDGDDALLRVDLGAQRGFLDSGQADVRCQCQVRSLHLEALCILERLQRFHPSAVQAEHIGRVADRQFRRVQVVKRIARRQRRRDRSYRIALPRWRIGTRDGREEEALLRAHLRLGLPQCCLRGRHRRIGLHRCRDKAVELFRVQHAPPLLGDLHAFHEALGFAALHRRGCRLGGQRLGRVRGSVGRLGRLEIGADGARRQNAANGQGASRAGEWDSRTNGRAAVIWQHGP